MNDLHKNSQVTKSLRKIEDIVLELDKAIELNEIDHASNASLKERYRKAVSLLPDYSTQEDSRFYVIDEAAALFAWIDKEKDFSRTKIRDAAAKKGDALLLSASGRKLAATYKLNKPSDGNTNKVGFMTGWLGFLYVTTIIIMSLSLLVAVAAVFSVCFLRRQKTWAATVVWHYSQPLLACQRYMLF